jgi:predicted transcriptional regulator
MDVARPATALLSRSEAALIGRLVASREPLSGRALATLAGVPQASAQRSLARLARHGLVDVQPAGRAHLYTLNRDHLLADAVRELAGARQELVRRMAAELAEWDIAPRHASIFGSAARASGDTSSDIDLFLVRPARVGDADAAWRGQVQRLADRVRRWSGNHLAVSEVGAREVARLRHEQPEVAREIASQGVTLAGPPAADLLRTPR